jgi:hypothetical protein
VGTQFAARACRREWNPQNASRLHGLHSRGESFESAQE